MYAIVLRCQTGRNASYTTTLSDTIMWFVWGKWSTTDESQSLVVRPSIFFSDRLLGEENPTYSSIIIQIKHNFEESHSTSFTIRFFHHATPITNRHNR